MSENIPTREQAVILLMKYNKSESLLKHAFAVEAINSNDVQ
jgi:predicted hydrolase (HD superfamily)